MFAPSKRTGTKVFHFITVKDGDMTQTPGINADSELGALRKILETPTIRTSLLAEIFVYYMDQVQMNILKCLIILTVNAKNYDIEHAGGLYNRIFEVDDGAKLIRDFVNNVYNKSIESISVMYSNTVLMGYYIALTHGMIRDKKTQLVYPADPQSHSICSSTGKALVITYRQILDFMKNHADVEGRYYMFLENRSLDRYGLY